MGSLLPQALGAYLASQRPGLVAEVGAGLAGLFGSGQYAVALLIIVNLLQVNVMNLYNAYMSSTTMITGIRGMKRVSLRFKFTVMSILMCAATMVAIVSKSNFSAIFSDFLVALMYVLVPWSAINLADYYVVCHGRYSIEDMYQKDGRYGMYRWRTLGVYLLSIVVQVPFMRLSFFVGPVAHRLGADISWLPGLLIPALLYIGVESRCASSAQRIVLP